eukprot:SAG22_NODE_10951_length_508_cov_0.662592_1_plen_99_part_00
MMRTSFVLKYPLPEKPEESSVAVKDAAAARQLSVCTVPGAGFCAAVTATMPANSNVVAKTMKARSGSGCRGGMYLAGPGPDSLLFPSVSRCRGRVPST